MKSDRYATAMRYIREQVFNLSQAGFARIAGRHYSTVSRWESGDLDPNIGEIRRLRQYAKSNGLKWDDDLIWYGKKGRTHAGTSHLKAKAGIAVEG